VIRRIKFQAVAYGTWH